MCTIVLWRVTISMLVHWAQPVLSCNERDCQELCNVSHEQLLFVAHIIQLIEWHILRDRHQLQELRQSILQAISWSKHPLQQGFETFLLPQSCWMCLVSHAMACVQWPCVKCSSKGIRWSSETCLFRHNIKQQLVEETGMLVEFCHRYNDLDHFNSYGGNFDLWLSSYVAV
jgi:hypothetical protein